MRAQNPATGETIACYDWMDDAALEAALAEAERAAAHWRLAPFRERAALLEHLSALLRRDRARLARLMTAEMGKRLEEAEAEVQKCSWVCDHYAEHGARPLGAREVATDATESFVTWEPLGAVLAVMPWNFPLWQVFRFAAPTLLAGNVALLKHAPSVPGCADAIAELFREAGAPAGVFGNLRIQEERVEGVLRDPRVAAVTLTGSERAGRAVAAIAASEVKPAVLELGGSDPFVVLADADIEDALDAAVIARLQNNGQSCIAAKRFVVESPLYERFCVGLAERFAALKVGDPTDRAVDLGPLAAPRFVEELDAQVRASVEAGARVRTGGAPLEGPGAFYPPTVLSEVEPGMRVFDEETFGPVAAVTRAASVDDAIALANRTRYGLGASLWTRRARARDLVPRLAAGHVAVNGIVKSDPRLPFGGIRRSGYGRELGKEGLRAFTNVKSVWIG